MASNKSITQIMKQESLKAPLIVTFSCQKNIFIFNKKSGLKPMPPYKVHQTVEKAKLWLMNQGILDPQIIEK